MNMAHGGATGDFLYALSILKWAGGGNVLFREPGVWNKGYKRPMDLLERFTRAQPYVRDVQYLKPGDKIDLDCDRWLRTLRAYNRPTHWSPYRAHAVVFGAPLNPMPGWLTVDRVYDRKRPVIFYRSPRMHSAFFRWDKVVKKYGHEAKVVGTLEEYKWFAETFPSANLPYHYCKDFYELAQVIGGARLVVGNSSSPMVLCHGLRVPLLMEMCESHAWVVDDAPFIDVRTIY